MCSNLVLLYGWKMECDFGGGKVEEENVIEFFIRARQRPFIYLVNLGCDLCGEMEFFLDIQPRRLFYRINKWHDRHELPNSNAPPGHGDNFGNI